MREIGNLVMPETVSFQDIDFLSLSGLMDEVSYRARAGLSAEIDPVRHYLEEGWRQGLQPYDSFEGEFLRPYYEASGLEGPPALTWLNCVRDPVGIRRLATPKLHR